MNTEQPKNEEERREYIYSLAFGNWVMAKQHEGATTVDISTPTLDIMRFFFNAGWAWGKNERPAVCPTCFDPTVPGEES